MSMNRNVTRLWIPLVGSLTVYLVPLVGPHVLSLLGEALLQEMARAGDREPWWLVADVTLALTAQIVVGLMLAWSLRGSRLRLLTWIPAIPMLNQLSWSLAAGSGTRRTNKGRSIRSAAVDPSGRLIAMSESTTLNIGIARDVVSVIRTNDGTEVFRVYLTRYARSQVVFFEGGLFGYSDLAGTHVLKVPQ